MHSRRARPTLRLLVEDLTADWASPYPRRVLTSGSLEDLHPLSELPHPIVAKAADSFRHDGDTDTFVGSIASSTTVPLMEIKAGQWRGGVWRDDTSGVHWLVVAGLAKGGHEDRDDFYEQIRRHDHTDEPLRWLPTDEDRRLLKQETAARLLTLWELSIQEQLLEALRAIHAGGTHQVEITHPITRDAVATLTMTVTLVREPDYAADEVDLELTPTRAHAGSNLLWQLTLRALITARGTTRLNTRARSTDRRARGPRAPEVFDVRSFGAAQLSNSLLDNCRGAKSQSCSPSSTTPSSSTGTRPPAQIR